MTDDNEYNVMTLDNVIRDAVSRAYSRDHDDYGELDFAWAGGSGSKSRAAPAAPRSRSTPADRTRARRHSGRGGTSPQLYEHRGERLTLSQWAAHLGVPKNTLQVRLARGWGIERTLTEPFAQPRTGRARRMPRK